jgi:uncharacterized membrane protein YccC
MIAAAITDWFSPEGIGVLIGILTAAVSLLWKASTKAKALEDSITAARKDADSAIKANDAARILACTQCRGQVDAMISAARNETSSATQELAHLRELIHEVKAMLVQLQSDVSAIAINQRARLERQPTGELLK